MTKGPVHQQWSSSSVFVLAAIGSAVGLGNIWKFPYTAGVSGGAAFVLVYILAIFCVALPLLVAEFFIGRHGRLSPPRAVKALALEVKKSPRWKAVGWLGVIIALLILPLYSMVAGWALAFIPRMFTSAFANGTPDDVAAMLSGLISSPLEPALWMGLFMLITALIVAKGLRAGIEKAVKFMMPMLFGALILLVIYSMFVGDLPAALDFMFTPDFSKIDTTVVLAAIGQAMFSVSVGVGIMMTFGAYIGNNGIIFNSALIVVLADTAVALLAGLLIFPLVFANGLDPTEGPGLIFVTLPLAFQQIPGGAWIGSAFFLLLFFAALTSTISVLEVPVSWAEEKKDVSRRTSALVISAVTFVFGLLAVFSFNILADVHPLGMMKAFETSTFFDLIEFFSFNILLPISGLGVAIFAGWVITGRLTGEAVKWPHPMVHTGWRVLIKYLVPLAIIGVFAQAMF